MKYSIHSFKDWTGRSLADRPASEFTGTVVRGLCICHETPDAVVLPNGVTDCTLLNCQLDNCIIPDGFTVDGGTNERYAPQNDLRDWKITQDGTPVVLMSEAYWAKLGASIDPADIPAEKIVLKPGDIPEDVIKATVNKAKP